MPLAEPSKNQRFVKVVKTEEKGSDVNFAVHLLNDCFATLAMTNSIGTLLNATWY